MKRLLFLPLLVLCLSGCMMEELDKESPVQEAKEYLVPIKMAGEVLEIEEGPLTKAVTDDLYGFRVTRKESGANEYNMYAYGLFDNINNINLKVKEGDSYNIVCSMVPNGKNIIYKGMRNTSSECYFNPFNMSISNEFIYSQDMIDNIQIGYADLIKEDGSYAANYEYIRYHSESSFIIDRNSSISINMKKMVFGIRIVPVNLVEGRLEITIGKHEYPTIKIDSSNPNPIEKIWTFSKFNLNDGTSMPYLLNVIYVKKDETFDILHNEDIWIKRNKMTTITLNLPDKNTPKDESVIEISKEEEDVQPGDNIIIDGK
ncbi:hypothetical protein [Parabacteroides distasonis]|uniref:hypothetical protein n=1 Tax=Parabacteroides distasonis TaxID=823 RepID=UPI00321B9452